MNAEELASKSFVLIHADWSAQKAKRVVAGHQVTHVVIHREEDGQQLWYLRPIGQARTVLAMAPADRTVRDVFELHEYQADQLVDALEPSPSGPAIVQDDGRIVGFIEPARAAGGGPTRRGGPDTGGPTRRGGPTGERRTRGGTATRGKPPGEEARSLQAEFPESVDRDAVEWLIVSIVPGTSESGSVPIALPADETVDVLVQPRRGFEVEGDAHGSIKVPAAGESLPLQFKLRAVEPGAGLVRVLAFHQGQPLGVISLTPTVSAAPATRTRGARPKAATARRARALAPASAQLPDLSVLIEERTVGAETEYQVRLSATDPTLGFNLKRFGPIRLALDPQKFFEEFFGEIDELPLDTPQQQEIARRKLAGKGSYLFETLVPPDLQEALWGLRDKITSIIIQSEEPWIPWELCKLQGREDGRIVEGKFLCEAYTVTRWLPGLGFKQPLSLKNVALVVPEDSGLPLAAEERDYVMSLAGRGRRVTAIPATFIDVQDALASGTYDAWHFTGHGMARDADPDRSAIYLKEEEPFRPQDLSGVASNAGITRPLVFLNACQVGRAGMSLTGVGGWANRFLEAGAGAFIGAYWSVYDTAACDFAKEVYKALTAGKPIGEAVKDARAAIRSDGDPTWLAYTVFADPLASVS